MSIEPQLLDFWKSGFQNGGSLDVWAKYFKNAEAIVGIDIAPKCADLVYSDPRISVLIGDVKDEKTRRELSAKTDRFDIIIDDGSHLPDDIVSTFASYFSLLSDGGIYIIEDLHTTYWKEFTGGLYDPYSSMAFFKKLADIVNFEHWNCSLSVFDFLRPFGDRYKCTFDMTPLDHLHSIAFTNSVCVIRKDAPRKNVRGRRVISGDQLLVTQVDYMNKVQFDQSDNEWSKIGGAESAWAEANASLREEIRLRDQEIEVMTRSVSWRATAPLRYIIMLLRRFARRVPLLPL